MPAVANGSTPATRRLHINNRVGATCVDSRPCQGRHACIWAELKRNKRMLASGIHRTSPSFKSFKIKKFPVLFKIKSCKRSNFQSVKLCSQFTMSLKKKSKLQICNRSNFQTSIFQCKRGGWWCVWVGRKRKLIC